MQVRQHTRHALNSGGWSQSRSREVDHCAARPLRRLTTSDTRPGTTGEHQAYFVTDTDRVTASPSGPVGRRSARAIVGTVAIVAAGALLLSGCGLDEARARARASQSSTPLPLEDHWRPGLLLPGAGGAGLQPDNGLNSQQVTTETLQSLLIQPNDIGKNVSIDFVDHGQEVAGQTSLDLCGGSFPSETRRQARYQVAAYSSTGTFIGISSEAVLYENPAEVTAALKELRVAQAACKAGKVANRNPEGKVTYYPKNPSPLVGLAKKSTLMPSSQRLVDETDIKLPDGSTHRIVAIYQVSGRFLTALYLSGTDDSDLSTQTYKSTLKVGEKIARRLRAATAAPKPTASTTSPAPSPIDGSVLT